MGNYLLLRYHLLYTSALTSVDGLKLLMGTIKTRIFFLLVHGYSKSLQLVY